MKNFSIPAFAAAIMFLCVSCLREGIDGPNGESAGQVSAEEVFWNIVGELVDRSERTDDYKDKTFKPTIGQPDNGDESIRVEAVNNLGTAVRRYNELVGANITEETASYTYSNAAVGTLTWNLSTDGKSWGTVDVSIPQVPGLQKIIYRSPEQGDVNGSVGDGGSAYYRFGDVIVRTMNDPDDIEDLDVAEYWICVRPSFGPEGKGDSHWVSVSPLPMANVWPYYKKEHKPYVASNGFEYGLPYNLGSKLEWHQDLAEMLFAILYPSQYIFNLQNYYTENWLGSPNGLRMFNDFDAQENLMYHNEAFWKNVQEQWKSKQLFEKLFGFNFDQMQQAFNPDDTGIGLTLLYNGYSWISGNSPKLYEVHYGNSTTDNTKKNMHEETTRVVQSQVVDPKKTQKSNINYPLDFYRFRDEWHTYFTQEQFFGDKRPRWVVRYATGQELMANKKNYDPQQPISGFEGNSEVYRYYRDVLVKNLTDAPEVTEMKNPGARYADGHGYFYPCCLVKDEEGSTWLCYSGWYDMDGFKSGDHYARFVSFDVKTTHENDGEYYTAADLIPEAEVPYAAVLLTNTFMDDDEFGDARAERFATARQQIRQYSNFDMALTLGRDTLWAYRSANKSVDVHGYIKAINFLYNPTSGRVKGKQPYMRYVHDGARMGPERSKIGSLYPYEHFFKTYNVPQDHYLSGKTLDLTDLYTFSTVLHSGVPADKWSRAARRETGQRDGAFTTQDRYTGSFDAGKFRSNPAQYVSAYHEPVVAMRFMKVDDPWAKVMPTTSVNQHTLTDLYHPVTKEDEIVNYLLTVITKMQILTGSSEYSFMDEQPYIVTIPN